MKSPRSVLILCAILLSFSLVLPVGVYAHPGRTDSQGGHTNHSTGEYHYHHGYSAHDHYDMDGDGQVDCSYDFVNNTNQSKSSTANNKVSTSYSTVVSDDTSTNQSAFDWGKFFTSGVPSILVIVAMICILVSWILHIFSDNIGAFILEVGLFLLPLAAAYAILSTIVWSIIDLLR